MNNNKKVWVTNLIFTLLLPALVYACNLIPCGFLCLNRVMWAYRIVLGCTLVFALVDARLYKRYTSKAALVLSLIWAILFLLLLCYYLVLKYS